MWIDDIQLGSGDASDFDSVDIDEALFDQHLIALSRILERASSANLRFKLSKCFLGQFSLETLGMIAGLGVVKPDPKKIQGITAWPRPSRLEDVERFLATTVFIREHLSPRYSELSKPLRDLLTDLQQSRRDNTYKGKSKFLPPSSAPADGAWPIFWKDVHEESFTALKDCVRAVVDLNVPDFLGAEAGKNPFHNWPDACKYGIGAGLFQGYPATITTAPNSFYHVLDLPTWATKHEIVRRYGELIRGAKSHSAHDIVKVKEAFETLGDVELRRAYDLSIGLSASRRPRIDLRPLGFFSKSLSKAQQAWPTWERELLSVLLTIMHYRSILEGQVVHIHTDHLNNTVLGENLTSPDKIL